MVIENMQRSECAELLARNRLGHLACARGGHPYVVPFSYAFDDRWLYGMATEGQKIEWLRDNPNACVEVEEVTGPAHWATVIVQGVFEELLDNSSELREARLHAYALLKQDAGWWEPAYGGGRTDCGEDEPIHFRISLDDVTGRRAQSSSP